MQNFRLRKFVFIGVFSPCVDILPKKMIEFFEPWEARPGGPQNSSPLLIFYLRKEKPLQRIVSRLRTTSIKRRLWSLTLLLSLMMALLGAFIIYNSISAVSGQLRRSGQQLLYSAATQMEESYSETVSLTKYPVIASIYSSTEVYRYLATSPKGLYSPLYSAIQAELYSELMLHPRADLLGVSDLNGLMLYCDTSSLYYKRTNCNFLSEVFTDTLARKGAPRLFTAGEARSLFSSLTIPDSSLYCARAIMQLNPFSAVGVVLCRVPLDNITEVFDASRLFDTQQLSILSSEGQLLYGAAPGLSAEMLAAMPADQLCLRMDWAARTVYQAYRLPDGCTACLRTPFDSLYPLLKLPMVLAVLLPLVIASVLFIVRMVTRSIQQPVDKLVDVCGRIFYEDFSPVEDAGACDEMHRLIEAFNVMAAHIQNLIEEVYKRNLTLAQTEMQLVRSQINPHFVYNTLETIRAEAYLHGQYAIADMTTLLGKTLRYGISRQGDCVTVGTELAHLQDYIALQQMRLGKKLNVLVSVPEELRGCYMIRLALQPLVENAIHHGLPSGDETGLIRVLGYQENGDLFFSVSDNGGGIAPEELARLQDYIAGLNSDYTSIGLRNTHCRLELFFGKPYGLSIRSVPGRGTSVTLRMPLMYKPFA